jgi:DNA-binding response OmpR family regulator
VTMRVLVAEDDAALRSVLERGLREAGYSVDVVGDGEAAVAYLRSYDYAAVVMDWRMPNQSGYDAIAKARQAGIRAPILMLTARDTHQDRVAGLDAGADDYLVKPFDFGELLARLRALQRRPAHPAPVVLACGNLVLDPASRTAEVAGEALTLTGTEFSILELLMRRAPAVVSRRSIAVQVWDEEADALNSNTIDVHLARLRSKLVAATVRIDTLRGFGYRLAASGGGGED